MNRAFKVIQGHRYWCQQKSRTGCCRNVQQCNVNLIFKTCKDYKIGKSANSSISTNSLQFDNSYLRNSLHCQKLESLAHLVWVYVHYFLHNNYYFWKVKLPESETANTKTEFVMK